MHSFLSNLCLFAQLIAKVALFTGLGPGAIAIAIYLQVFGDGKVAAKGVTFLLSLESATRPLRKEWEEA